MGGLWQLFGGTGQGLLGIAHFLVFTGSPWNGAGAGGCIVYWAGVLR